MLSELEDVYRAAFQNSDAAIAIVDVRDERLIDATDGFLHRCRLERGTSINRPVGLLFDGGSAAQLVEMSRTAVRDNRTQTATLTNMSSRTARFSEVDVRAVSLSRTLACLTVLTHSPLTPSRRHMIDDFGMLSGALVYIYDLQRSRTRYINRSLADLLGYAVDSPIFLDDVLPLIHDQDIDAFTRHVEAFATLAPGEVARECFRIRRPTGEWRWIDNRAGVYSRDPQGRVRRVVGYAFDVTKPRETAAQLADASAALLNTEVKERRRIARELHDSTAQHLVAAELLLAAYERRQPPDETTIAISEVRNTLAIALREIRTLSFLLHPPRLRENGLGETLRVFAEGFAKRAGLTIDVKLDDLPTNISPELELALFRVAQEALMNVRRHANADHVTLRLVDNGDHVTLEIEDDGQGIEDFEVVSPGVGVDGMRARLASLGGELTIESPGKGTVVRAEAPWSEHMAY